jgi:hypothetical protein
MTSKDAEDFAMVRRGGDLSIAVPYVTTNLPHRTTYYFQNKGSRYTAGGMGIRRSRGSAVRLRISPILPDFNRLKLGRRRLNRWAWVEPSALALKFRTRAGAQHARRN